LRDGATRPEYHDEPRKLLVMFRSAPVRDDRSKPSPPHSVRAEVEEKAMTRRRRRRRIWWGGGRRRAMAGRDEHKDDRALVWSKLEPA